MSNSDQPLEAPVFSIRKMTLAEFNALYSREQEDDEPRHEDDQPTWKPLG